MAKDNSVAPRERVNVTFTPNTGDVQQDVELPLKLVVLGDFTQRQDERSIEQRKPIAVDANSFDDVLAKQELSLAFTVPNRLQDEADNENDLPVQLDIRSWASLEGHSLLSQLHRVWCSWTLAPGHHSKGTLLFLSSTECGAAGH